MNRTPAVALMWFDFQARTVALAAALDGRADFVCSRRFRHPVFLPLRYLSNAVASWRHLNQAAPSTVVVITPPVFAPLLAWLWCVTHRRILVVDCHTSAFHSRKWGWAQPLHRFVLRRARLALVHTESAAAELERWGARTLLLPDDVPDVSQAEPQPRCDQPVILVAGSLDGNEPIDLAVEAARRMPDVQFRFTGHLSRLRPNFQASAPRNVRFTGFLPYGRFLGEMQAADVVAVFSTDPEIMNRAAFEAVGLGRPLVLSDLAGLRARFQDAALFAQNEPGAMADALRTALRDLARLEQRSRALEPRLRQQHDAALARLKAELASATPVAVTSKPSAGQSPAASARSMRRVLVVSAHEYPTQPLLRRNVDHLVSQGVQLDLVCVRDGKVGTPRSGPRTMRIFALPVKHRRKRALSYVWEYAAFFLMALPIVTVLSMRRRYDVVQVDSLPDFLVFTALVPRLRGSRVVLYIYDLFPEMAMTRLKASQDHPIVRAARQLERWSARFANHVITVSRCYRNLLAARGIEAARVSILYNTQPMPLTISHHPPDRPVLITHASLLERYGIQVAIRAVPYLVDSWPELIFEVLGEGEYRHQLEALATELGVAERVRFVGFLPRWTDAMERISRASIGIVPVIADGYGELILPGKLLEYAAIGIPVICSRLPGIEEAFPPDALAYFQQGDAKALAAQVDRLLRDPVAAKAQSGQAREALQRIAWETVAHQYTAALAPA